MDTTHLICAEAVRRLVTRTYMAIAVEEGIPAEAKQGIWDNLLAEEAVALHTIAT